jgi:oxygen-independent coproporphyrinogen-3 oxidase
MEANPEDVSVTAARAWLGAGVTRLSLGVQSFDDRALTWMRRVHDADRAERAIQELRDAGLGNVSVDLIFALPEELGRSWERDVDRVLAIAPPHVSLYGLTVEEKTPLGRQHARGEVVEAPEESYERDFLLAHESMTAAGLEHYEVSNFGRPSFRSRHNSSYWTQAPYAAVGPGAHEFDGARRRWNVASYTDWVRRLSDEKDPVAGSEQLTSDNIVAETVYLGLRTMDGLVISDSEKEIVGPWVREGWASIDAGEPAILRLTALGWLRLDSLAAILTEARSR